MRSHFFPVCGNRCERTAGGCAVEDATGLS